VRGRSEYSQRRGRDGRQRARLSQWAAIRRMAGTGTEAIFKRRQDQAGSHTKRGDAYLRTLLIQVTLAQSNFAFWGSPYSVVKRDSRMLAQKPSGMEGPHDILNVRYHPKRIAQRPRKKLSKALDEWNEQFAQLNDFIRAQQQRLRDGKVQGLGGLQIDDQLELRGLLDWQIGRSDASQ